MFGRFARRVVECQLDNVPRGGFSFYVFASLLAVPTTITAGVPRFPLGAVRPTTTTTSPVRISHVCQCNAHNHTVEMTAQDLLSGQGSVEDAPTLR